MSSHEIDESNREIMPQCRKSMLRLRGVPHHRLICFRLSLTQLIFQDKNIKSLLTLNDAGKCSKAEKCALLYDIVNVIYMLFTFINTNPLTFPP